MKYDVIVNPAWQGKDGELLDGVPVYRTLKAVPETSETRTILMMAGDYDTNA